MKKPSIEKFLDTWAGKKVSQKRPKNIKKYRPGTKTETGLIKSLKKNPSDIELHKKFVEYYRKSGEWAKAEVHEEFIEALDRMIRYAKGK